MPKTKTEQQKKIDQKAKCISGENPDTKISSHWRPRPNDPFIYISFSADLFKKVYGSDPNVDKQFKKWGFTNQKENVIAYIKALIEKEWGEKAGLPIKFLPDDISVEEAKEKNIVFAISSNKSLEQSMKEGNTFSTLSAIKKLAAYKFIRIPKLTDEDLKDNEAVASIVHEFGHAIAELKHPMKSQDDDVGPFCYVDCSESVMGYQSECNAYKKKIVDLNIVNRDIFDPDPVLQAKLKEANKEIPITVGEVDIAAAKMFNESWEKRNKKAKKDQDSESASENFKEELRESTKGLNSSSTKSLLSKGDISCLATPTTTTEPSASNQFDITLPPLNDTLVLANYFINYLQPYLGKIYSMGSSMVANLFAKPSQELACDDREKLLTLQKEFVKLSKVMMDQTNSYAGKSAEYGYKIRKTYEAVNKALNNIDEILSQGKMIASASLVKFSNTLNEVTTYIHEFSEVNREIKKQVKDKRNSQKPSYYESTQVQWQPASNMDEYVISDYEKRQLKKG